MNAIPERNVYVRLPAELNLNRNIVGRLKRCLYGTRDAGALWESTFTRVLLDLGFTQGVSSPCCFIHRQCHVALVVHGNDFTALGPE